MPRYRTAQLAALAVAGLALETTVLDVFSPGGARVELLLLMACFASLFARHPRQAFPAVWILGLLKDLGSGGPAGLHALLFLAAGGGILRIRQILFRDSPWVQMGATFLATGGVLALSGLFVSAATGPLPAGVIAGRTLLSALLTAVCAPAVFAALERTPGGVF